MAPVPAWVKQLKPSGPPGPDLLQKERAGSSVNVTQLSSFLFGQETLQRKTEILQLLESDALFDKSQNYFAGRDVRVAKALARAKRLRQLGQEHGWSHQDYLIGNSLVDEANAYDTHDLMFTVTCRDQSTPEQKELFYEKASEYKIVGCYAQTELGHGSNLRGLETTATWNPEDKTFTLHSPHLTASKWWIGGLGRTANHAAVMAQLIVDGKKLGPHPFVVQIRDLETNKPLPNVHIGDIGPKFGYNTMDNGFLLFNNVKIPHISMLARFSRVDQNTNKYIQPKSSAMVYGTMTFIRSMIVMNAGNTLARGVTIATRYCAVRRQNRSPDAPQSDKGETQVLDYTLVQIRLFTLLATSFALHFTGKAMALMYQDSLDRNYTNTENDDKFAQGSDAEAIFVDLHATSCGLKSLASQTAAEGLEVCRIACGGHGYSSFSGMGSHYATYVMLVNGEGDNFLLTQQVARHLLKSAREVAAGARSTNDTARILRYYLDHAKGGVYCDLTRDEDIVSAFAWRAAYLTFEALRQIEKEKRSWNDSLVDFYRLSNAHSQYLVVKNFFEAVKSQAFSQTLNHETARVMSQLFTLYALHTLEQSSTEFIASKACSLEQVQVVQSKTIMSLLAKIRPHAVKLVDAWNFPDFQLDSSLGRYDGKVYEDMFYRASELNPLNDITLDPYPGNPVVKDEGKPKSVKSLL